MRSFDDSRLAKLKGTRWNSSWVSGITRPAASQECYGQEHIWIEICQRIKAECTRLNGSTIQNPHHHDYRHNRFCCRFLRIRTRVCVLRHGCPNISMSNKRGRTMASHVDIIPRLCCRFRLIRLAFPTETVVTAIAGIGIGMVNVVVVVVGANTGRRELKPIDRSRPSTGLASLDFPVTRGTLIKCKMKYK